MLAHSGPPRGSGSLVVNNRVWCQLFFKEGTEELQHRLWEGLEELFFLRENLLDRTVDDPHPLAVGQSAATTSFLSATRRSKPLPHDTMSFEAGTLSTRKISSPSPPERVFWEGVNPR